MDASGSGFSEVSVSNQRDVSSRPSGTIDPKYSVAKGKGLRIVHSDSPTIAAKLKPKKTRKQIFKRD